MGVMKLDIGKSKNNKLSWKEKVELCNAWKKSGLSKNEFCRSRGISGSSFAGWCAKLWPEEIKKAKSKPKPKKDSLEDWLELDSLLDFPMPEPKNYPPPKVLAIEIKVANGVVISLSLPVNELINLVRDFNNAAPVIR